ncbi:hypothetical protein ACQEUX_12790 [Micromonospora sp. CA-259024]
MFDVLALMIGFMAVRLIYQLLIQVFSWLALLAQSSASEGLLHR